MPVLHMRFYAELNEFLRRDLRGRRFDHQVPARVPLRDVIEGLGVPHTEVDLVLVDGVSVNLSAVPADGAFVSVYPVFEAFDIASITQVRAEPLRAPAFVLDVHLGRLSAYLRMAGFDVWYRTDADDRLLAGISADDHRILLTRDQGLLKRRLVTHGYYIRTRRVRDQLAEVIRRFDLSRLVAPFTRCTVCNAPLEDVEPAAVEGRVPPRVRATQQSYRACPGCGRVYWEGTHHARMRLVLAEALGDARAQDRTAHSGDARSGEGGNE
jgi:uncharacterized protein with PIN domain